MRLNHAQLEKLKTLPAWFAEIVARPRGAGFLPFEEARSFVRSLGLKTYTEWEAYRPSKPTNIPALPQQIYKDAGWVNMGDWLGTGHTRERLPFEEARAFVHSLHLKGWDYWRAYCKSGKKPANIPASPHKKYKDTGWVGFGDWVGTGRKASAGFLSFEKARAFVRNLGLTNWTDYCKSGKRPRRIPSNPSRVYKGKGWINWSDWLGCTRQHLPWKKVLPFEEARAFVRSLKLTSHEWRAYCKSGKEPFNIPSAPNVCYKDNWVSWRDWVGTTNAGKKSNN